MKVIHEFATVGHSFEDYQKEEFTIKLSGKEAYALYLNLHEDNHPKILTPLMELLSKQVCSHAWQGVWK